MAKDKTNAQADNPLAEDTVVDNPTRTVALDNGDAVAAPKFRAGYAPGDVAKATLYQRLDGRIVESADAGSEDGFRGTVVVQEGDTVTNGAARLLAE